MTAQQLEQEVKEYDFNDRLTLLALIELTRNSPIVHGSTVILEYFIEEKLKKNAGS